jgi:hypothetical protein
MVSSVVLFVLSVFAFFRWGINTAAILFAGGCICGVIAHMHQDIKKLLPTEKED